MHPNSYLDLGELPPRDPIYSLYKSHFLFILGIPPNTWDFPHGLSYEQLPTLAGLLQVNRACNHVHQHLSHAEPQSWWRMGWCICGFCSLGLFSLFAFFGAWPSEDWWPFYFWVAINAHQKNSEDGTIMYHDLSRILLFNLVDIAMS